MSESDPTKSKVQRPAATSVDQFLADAGDCAASRTISNLNTSALKNPDHLLSRKEVAEEYGLSVKFLERAAWVGDGPTMVKLGHRSVRYRRADIVSYIALRRV